MKNLLRTIVRTSFTLVFSLTTAHAAVTPNPLFSEGAVLQQQRPVPVWGTAADGERVTVEFQKQKLSTIASNGEWKVALKPLHAGGPFTLKISGENVITRTNILVGEVWICSGQSNMEMGLAGCENAQAAITNAADPLLRFLTVPKAIAMEPQRTAGVSGWVAASPATAPSFSGVAYYFGRDLRRSRKVPIGLIHTSWGGTPAEAWTAREGFVAEPVLKPMLDGLELARAGYPQRLAQYQQAEPELKQKYAEAVAQAKAAGKNPPPAPVPPADPAKSAAAPAGLYNAMIAPLQPYAIRGAIWYQGESNAGAHQQYRTLLPTMIRTWRTTWGQGDFPFLIVQLAPFANAGFSSGWAELREAQWFTTQTVPKTGMAVITDVGDCRNIHPTRKEPVGGRLALAARAIAYGERVEYSGPEYRSFQVAGDKVTLRFAHLGGGLVAKGGDLKGFTIAGADQKFVPAKAEIHGKDVVVSSAAVPQPAAVRYGWTDCPDVNLFNKAGLPATPFRTDDPARTAPLKK